MAKKRIPKVPIFINDPDKPRKKKKSSQKPQIKPKKGNKRKEEDLQRAHIHHRPEPTTPPPSPRRESSPAQAIKRDKKGRLMPGTWPLNPGGRPSVKPITEAIREALSDPERVANIVDDWIRQSLGKRGKPAMAQLISDRLEGKPTQTLNIDKQGSIVIIRKQADETPALPEEDTETEDKE